MSKFAVKSIDIVVGKIKFFKLTENEICQYDNFCDEIARDKALNSQLKTIVARMNDFSNMRMLPKEKLRDITPDKEIIKEYEIKTRDLRVYFIKDDIGNVIVIAGKKTSQQKDIKKFRIIKKAYLNK